MIHGKYVITAQGPSLHQWLKRSTTTVICSSGSYRGSVHIYRRISARKLDMPAPAPSLFALFLLDFPNPHAWNNNGSRHQPAEWVWLHHTQFVCLCLSQDILFSSLGGPRATLTTVWHGLLGVGGCIFALPPSLFAMYIHITYSCVLHGLTCLHIIHVEGNKGLHT